MKEFSYFPNSQIPFLLRLDRRRKQFSTMCFELVLSRKRHVHGQSLYTDLSTVLSPWFES